MSKNYAQLAKKGNAKRFHQLKTIQLFAAGSQIINFGLANPLQLPL